MLLAASEPEKKAGLSRNAGKVAGRGVECDTGRPESVRDTALQHLKLGLGGLLVEGRCQVHPEAIRVAVYPATDVHTEPFGGALDLVLGVTADGRLGLRLDVGYVDIEGVAGGCMGNMTLVEAG